MKKVINRIAAIAIFLSAWSCSEDDIKGPDLPDVAKISETPVKVFSLESPTSGTSLNIKPSSASVDFVWEVAEGAISYEWLYDSINGDFSDPLLIVTSDSNGLKPNLSLTYTELYDLLGDAGVPDGGIYSGKWTVRAKSEDFSQLARSAKSMLIQRGGVTFTIYVPDNTPADFDVFVAGEFDFLEGASNWQQPGTNQSLKMNPNEDGSYSIILGIPEGITFQYKYFITPPGASAWNHGERIPNDDGQGTSGAPNRSFSYNGTNDNNVEVVSFWEGYDYDYILFDLDATGANTPDDKDVFIAGEMTKLDPSVPRNWQRPGSNARLTLTRSSADRFFIVFPLPASGTSFEYKYAVSTLSEDGSWDNEQIPTGNRSYTYDGNNPVISDSVTEWKGI